MLKYPHVAVLGFSALLVALTGCVGTSTAGDHGAAGAKGDQTVAVAAFVEDLQTSTESEAGSSVAITGGDISEVPSRVGFGDVSGKGPFTVYFTCQVPDGSVRLTLDSTTTTEVDCAAGTTKITGIQKIALTGGLNIEVQGEAKTGLWALVAKGRA